MKLKVFGGGDGKNRVIGAFQSKAAFCKASGIGRDYCGETGNVREIAVASQHLARLLGKSSGDHHGPYRFYKGQNHPLGKVASGQRPHDPELKAGLEARQLPPAPAVQPFSPALASKLGSIVVHAEELVGNDGHEFDAAAFRALMADDEVQAWLRQMRSLALIPVKRK